jgi:peptidyl-Lys metalloendopeptidase
MDRKWMAALAGALAAWTPAQASTVTANVTVNVTPERQTLGRDDDVVVLVTMTNTSNATAYLLKWQTPFGAVEAPLFEVTRDGLPVRYLGRQVKRAAPAAADYISLKPGASRSARVELSALYRMDVTGAYSIRYRGGMQLFSKPGLASPSMHMLAEPTRQAASVWIDGRLPRGLADSMPVPAPESGAGLSFSQCSNAQQEAIATAAQAAQAMALDAETSMQQTPGARYASWFGAADAERVATVARHFVAIKEAFASKPVTVDCGCNADYYAYVYPNQPYKIHVCKAFWGAPPAGTDSRGGTLLHEMSHFNVVAGTNDWVYGQSAAAALAASDPVKAVDNADSHEYFGENTPQQGAGGSR